MANMNENPNPIKTTRAISIPITPGPRPLDINSLKDIGMGVWDYFSWYLFL